MSEPAHAVEVLPPGARPVQRKVSFASVAAYVSGLGLATVVQSLQDGSLIAALPPVASAILTPLVPALLVLLTGYLTSNRLDAVEVKRFADAVQVELAARVEQRVHTVIDQRFGEGQS